MKLSDRSVAPSCAVALGFRPDFIRFIFFLIKWRRKQGAQTGEVSSPELHSQLAELLRTHSPCYAKLRGGRGTGGHRPQAGPLERTGS